MLDFNLLTDMARVKAAGVAAGSTPFLSFLGIWLPSRRTSSSRIYYHNPVEFLGPCHQWEAWWWLLINMTSAKTPSNSGQGVWTGLPQLVGWRTSKSIIEPSFSNCCNRPSARDPVKEMEEGIDGQVRSRSWLSCQSVVAPAFNSSTLEEPEAGRSLWVQGHPGTRSKFQNRLKCYTEKTSLETQNKINKQYHDTEIYRESWTKLLEAHEL